MRPTSVNITAAQDNQSISVGGGTYTILVSGEQTGDTYAIIDMLVPPKAGPGPHAHSEIQESFYVLEGEVVFKTETQKQVATKGAVIEIPKGGAIHCFKNESNENARLLCIVKPAGLDRFFKEVGKPVRTNTFLPVSAPTPEVIKRMMEIGTQYGQEFFPADYLG